MLIVIIIIIIMLRMVICGILLTGDFTTAI